MPPLRLTVCVIEFCAIADAGVVSRTARLVGHDAGTRWPWPAADISAAFALHWAGYSEAALLGSWPRAREEELPQELPCMN